MFNNTDKLTHIAIVPDGNRRWAKLRGFKPWIGHKNGTKNFEEIFEKVLDFKIPYFSFWASSEDNLKKRSKLEVDFLLNTFKKNFKDLANNKKIHKNQVKINIFGSWRKQFPKAVKEPMEQAINATKKYNKFHFNFFIAYSGIGEMMNAIKDIAKEKIKNPDIKITESIIKKHLLTKDIPTVDYLIRTGGEPHMSSGFMMWDIADAQMYFSKKLWPDFNANDFEKAIKEYYSRKRKFGA